MDRVATFFSEKTPRRFIAIATFLALIYLFRQLAFLLVFFVTFERSIGAASRLSMRYMGLSRKQSVLAVITLVVCAFGGLAWLGIGKTVRAFAALQESYPERLAELRDNPLVERFQEQFGGTDNIIDGLRHYAGDAMSAASAVGHFIVYILIGFILAIVYSLEQDELRSFWSKVEPRSLLGTLGRWTGHLADATIVTVQLQLIVAVFNTTTTLPVLLLIGVPHVGALMVLIFVSALVPVIGNIVSGTVLSLLAYKAKGWFGVGIFVALTFALHKIESYYLSPRLTARHVKIPGFLLIVSLLACEHLWGFKGLFLSFPILFVAGRVRGEFVEEEEGPKSSPLVLSDALEQLPILKDAE